MTDGIRMLASRLEAIGLFDPAWYLTRYPNSGTNEVEAFCHYATRGKQEDRSPGPNFDGAWFRQRYPVVQNEEINPLVYYHDNWRSFGLQRKQFEGIAGYAPEILDFPPAVLVEGRTGTLRLDNFDAKEEATPLVSVVVLCFNNGRFLEETIDSILASTFKDFDIVIVEGGSSELGSVETASRLNASKVRVIYQPVAKRTGQNRNFGIGKCRSKYICCIDGDDLLRPTFLEKAVHIAETGDFDVVSCSYEDFGTRNMQFRMKKRPELIDLLEYNPIITSALFRREAWHRAGGYSDVDPNYFGYIFEDWMFWMRLAAMGAKMINIEDEFLFLHRVHASSIVEAAPMVPFEYQQKLIREINRDVLTSIVKD